MSTIKNILRRVKDREEALTLLFLYLPTEARRQIYETAVIQSEGSKRLRLRHLVPPQVNHRRFNVYANFPAMGRVALARELDRRAAWKALLRLRKAVRENRDKGGLAALDAPLSIQAIPSDGSDVVREFKFPLDDPRLDKAEESHNRY